MRPWHHLLPTALICGCCIGARAQETPATAAQATSAPAVLLPAAAASTNDAEPAAKAPGRPEFHGSVELDNQYSAGTDPLRATLALSYSNLFSKQDELSALYQVAPQDAKQVSVFIANYATHPLPDGLQPSIYFLDANSNVPVADTVGVLGKGQIVGFRLGHALNAAKTQSLTLAMDYRHFRDTTALDENSASVTPVSYWNLQLAYAGNWKNAQREEALTVSANFGPHGGANATSAIADGDFHADANYFYVRADGALLATLPKGVRLYLRAAGQYSGRSLIIDEEYPVAGVDGVRGYLEGEVVGDRALKGTVQLQSPVWKHGVKELADGLVYFDAAVADVIDASPGGSLRLHARSWGFGADLFPWKTVGAAVVWARPLVTTGATQAGDSRILFLVRGTF
ncbi:MAG TPA: ShlB/FhaC/HecB family hemolysin secretion/activation protein [Steroidobacteraceae bacterium]